MKSRFALALVLSFAGGVLLTAGVGGALGVFDRGPTEQDVHEARERGREVGAEEVAVRMSGSEQEAAEMGFQRGREASEWPYLDRLPNPDSWFLGVQAGRDAANLHLAARQYASVQDAWDAGFADGRDQGINESLGIQRFAWVPD